MRTYICRACKREGLSYVHSAASRGRLPLSCTAHRSARRNAVRRDRYSASPAAKPECCCDAVCPQHGQLAGIHQDYDWKPMALSYEEDAQVKSMTLGRSGSAIDRPGRTARSPQGDDEGSSTWFPSIFAEWSQANGVDRTRHALAADHEWWTGVNLKTLAEPAVLPDGRWYKTDAPIGAVINGFTLCCAPVAH